MGIYGCLVLFHGVMMSSNLKSQRKGQQGGTPSNFCERRGGLSNQTGRRKSNDNWLTGADGNTTERIPF